MVVDLGLMAWNMLLLPVRLFRQLSTTPMAHLAVQLPHGGGLGVDDVELSLALLVLAPLLHQGQRLCQHPAGGQPHMLPNSKASPGNAQPHACSAVDTRAVFPFSVAQLSEPQPLRCAGACQQPRASNAVCFGHTVALMCAHASTCLTGEPEPSIWPLASPRKGGSALRAAWAQGAKST